MTGTLDDLRLSTNVAFLYGTNTFAGVLTATNLNNTFSGAFIGNGSALTGFTATQVPNLDASKVSSGILAPARLPANVVYQPELVAVSVALDAEIAARTAAIPQAIADLKAADNTFTGANTFAGVLKASSLNGTGGTLVVGTTNNQPLELKVNGLRALRLEPAVDELDDPSPNVIGGATNNSISTYGSFIGGGRGNAIQFNAKLSTIAGGANNTIQPHATYSTIGGGGSNTIETNAAHSTIAGGIYNTIQTNADISTIGGGYLNTIETNASLSTIGGGYDNTIQLDATYSTIGGGSDNTIQANGQYATIPGGRDNSATAYAFAAGRRARAIHTGAFVWADSTSVNFLSSANNEFNVRASGGTRIFSNSGLTAGVTLAAGGGAWENLSDRNAKENFTPVDGVSVLAKVAALPLTTWNYKAQDQAIRHIGPMAQDFKAAFGVGQNDTTISTIDTDGVALVAIQGLNQKLEAQAAQAQAKDAQIKTLETRLAELEKLVRALTK